MFASTGQWGKPFSIPYRTRRISKRRFRRMLWRDTIAKAHYRSLQAFSFSHDTPTGVELMKIATRRALDPSQSNSSPPGVDFWTLEGGLQQLDANVVPPNFTDDIILRGGISRVVACNINDTNPVKVRIWAIWAKSNPNSAKIINQNVSTEWDPSLVPDFQKFGRVLYEREAILLPGGNPLVLVHRFKPQKIDQAVFKGELGVGSSVPGGSQLYWMIGVANYSAEAASAAVHVCVSYNLSFSGDADN